MAFVRFPLPVVRTARFALGCLLLAGPAAGTARAQVTGLSIAWQDCRIGASGSNLDFGCTATINDFPLYPTVRLATAVDSVISMELVIDMDVNADPLPAWWEMEPGGCRANVAWVASAAPPPSCTDAWGGLGTASPQGWLPSVPGGSGRHGRLLVAASVLPENAVGLPAGEPIAICRVAVTAARVATCAGCTIPACLVFNSVLIRRLPGSSFETFTVSAPESPGFERVTWQGGAGADCQSVPVRRTTWGAVKALYR